MNRKILAFNPELARNMSIELTPMRMLMMPFIVFIIAGFYSQLPLGRNNGSLMIFSTTMFYIITIIWGGKNISDSMLEEYNSGTWDWQRMSTLSPLKMTLGKLFGSTIYNWYGGIFYLLIYMFSAMSAKTSFSTLVLGLSSLVSTAIFIHSLMLMIILLQMKRAGERTKLKSSNWLLIIPIFILNWWSSSTQFSLLKIFAYMNNGSQFNEWYGIKFGLWGFYILTLFYPIWSVAGVYRSMRTELQYKNGLKWWVLFLVTAFLYNGGFLNFFGGSFTVRILMMSVTSGISYFILSYVLIMFEPIDSTAYKRIFQSIKAKNYTAISTQLPIWTVTFLAFIILLLVHIIFSFNPDLNSPEIPEYISIRYLTDSAFDQNSIGLTMLFFGIRDFCMIILINLVSKKKRANFSSTIYLIMVYLILPYLLKGNGLADFLSPFNSGSDPGSVMIGIVEAALAVYAVIFVWRQKASIE
jgi:hypothetical protein